VVVPPGSALLFVENMVHMVTGTAYTFTLRRIFLTGRVWAGAPPCTSAYQGQCSAPPKRGRACFGCRQRDDCYNGQCTLLKSGQLIPVYPETYRLNFDGFLPEIGKQVPGIVVVDQSGKTCYLRVHPPIEVVPYSPHEIELVLGWQLCLLG
jgi:hypothetical protein